MYMVQYLILLFIGVIYGSICKPEPEELTKLNQLKALNAANIKCVTDTKTLKNTTESYCSGHFDGIMCWPDTKAGVTSTRSCPSYIIGFNVSGYAVKECLDTGEWYTNPILNKTYANYSGCIPKTKSTFHVPTRTELIKTHMPRIQVIYRVGYSISLMFLIVAVVILTSLRKLRCQRNTIHINLFLSFILRCIVCFIKDEYAIPEGESNVMEDVIRQLTSSHESWRCKLVHTLFFYILMANYMWVFAEGMYLHSLIFVTTFHNMSPSLFRILVMIGWVAPVFCIVPWVITRIKLEDTLCWNLHDPEFGFQWIIEGPIMFTLFINFIFFLNIIRVLFIKLSATHSRDPKCYRKLAKSTLVLIPLFGVHYIAFMALPICLDPEVEIVWMYLELLFSSFQGFVVTLLFCFLNGEVKSEIRKHWRIYSLRRQSLVSTRSSRKLSTQSTTLGRDQDSPIFQNKRDKNALTMINQINYVPGSSKGNTNYESIETDIKKNGQPLSYECELETKIKDVNEHVAFLEN